MAILVLNNSPARMYNYKDWLSSMNEEIIILTSSKYYESFIEEGYSNVFSFDNYTNNGGVELKAVNLSKHHDITYVIATNEFDLIRAAKLRRMLSINGQSLQSALAYRDKTVMKEILGKSGVNVPKFNKADYALDIINFVNKHGYPVVVKPRNGAASVDTHIIHNKSDLKKLLEKGLDSNLEVEEFIPGNMYHVDGLIVENDIVFIWPSRYLNDCLSYQNNEFLASLMLEKNNRLTSRLINFTKEVISNLPSPGNCAFHAEVFHTPNDDLVLCEIASRVGGGKIPEAIKHSFNINLREIMVKSQCGLIRSKEFLNAQQGEYKNLSGWILIPPKKGKLVNLKRENFSEWVIEINIRAEIGKSYTNASSSIDNLASFVIDGAEEEILEDRIIQLVELFNNTMEWEI